MKLLKALAACAAVIGFSSSAYALTGLEVAQKMDAVDTSKSSTLVNTMTIVRGSQQMTRVMNVQVKKYGPVEKQYIYIFKPADVKDTSYLTWNYKDVNKDDDMWIYMPSESIVRRVSGGGKKGPFMRSDFSNEDITKREVADDTFSYLREEDVAGVKCHVIEALPVKPDKSGYKRRVLWVRSDIWLPAKIEYYNFGDKKIKECLYGGYVQISGIWVASKRKMTSVDRGTYSMLESSDIRFNVDLSDSLFEQANLKR